MTREDLPAYSDLILPTVKAVGELGGSAKAREITGQVLTDLGATDEMLVVMQPTRPDASVLLERIAWARSYAKLIGALESPSRGVFLITPLGKELLNLPPEEGQERTLELVSIGATGRRIRSRRRLTATRRRRQWLLTSLPRRWRRAMGHEAGRTCC